MKKNPLDSAFYQLDEIRPDKSVGFAWIAIGAFFVLVGFDLISSKNYNLPPHFLIACLGASCLLPGISIAMKSFGLIMHSPLHLVLRFMGLIGLAISILWVIFGANPLPLVIRIVVGAFAAVITGLAAVAVYFVKFQPEKIAQIGNNMPELNEQIEKEVKRSKNE